MFQSFYRSNPLLVFFTICKFGRARVSRYKGILFLDQRYQNFLKGILFLQKVAMKYGQGYLWVIPIIERFLDKH